MADEAGKREGDEHEGLPEVEAELVGETAQPEDPFDEDSPQSAEKAAVEPDAQGRKPPRKGLTPGVMLFLGFVAFALSAFAVWRFTPHGVLPGAPAPAAEEVKSAGEAKTLPAAAPEHDPEPEAADEKIVNAPAKPLKPAPGASESGPGYLPPVTAEGAAKIGNPVEDGAKEAMRRFAEEDAAAAQAAPDAAQPDRPDDGAGDVAEGFGYEAAAEVAGAGDAADAEPPADTAREPRIDAAAAPDQQQAQAAAAVDEEIAAMRARFDEEKASLQAALDDERRARDGLDAEIARLRAALAEAQADRDAAANEETAALRAEVERLRREQANTSSRQMRAAFALAALARAVDQGDPFTEELEAVAEFEPAASAALDAHAETGVATEAALRIGFDAAARAALAAAGQENAGGGLPGIVARAQSLVSVRPAAPMAGDAPGAVLSRAEHALEEGDVAFALLELEDLPVSAQEAMAGWMEEARARAEAVAALDRLQAEISGEAG